jgi:hypothetical protein
MGRGIDSTPLAMVLCSVLITWPAFGMGSDIRRGPRRGGPSGTSPARAPGGEVEDPCAVSAPQEDYIHI